MMKDIPAQDDIEYLAPKRKLSRIRTNKPSIADVAAGPTNLGAGVINADGARRTRLHQLEIAALPASDLEQTVGASHRNAGQKISLRSGHIGIGRLPAKFGFIDPGEMLDLQPLKPTGRSPILV